MVAFALTTMPIGSSSRDPIGYQGGVNVYPYATASPLISLDPEGLCEEQWIGPACFKMTSLRIDGKTFGDHTPPFLGEKWWLQGAFYFSGTISGRGSFSDTIRCCRCPERDVKVNIFFSFTYQYDYMELATRAQMGYQLIYSLFVPFGVKAILFSPHGFSIWDDIDEMLEKELIAKDIFSLTPAAVCASDVDSIFVNISLNKSRIKSGRPPEKRTGGERKQNWELTDYFSLVRCWNLPVDESDPFPLPNTTW